MPSTPDTHVYFFATCLVDLFLPDAGMDAIALLEREGVTVHYPTGQSCCGQPAYTSGQREEALAVARAQLGLFPHDWPIVVPSGSCAGMMKHHWPRLFEGTPDAARAQAIAQRVVELADYLLNVLQLPQRPSWQRSAQQPIEQVAVHTSCSARREMGTHRHGWALIDALPGVQRLVHEHESECCGFGGTFSIRHPDISGAMVADKADALQGCGATRFVTADGGCLLNINGKLAKQGDASCGGGGACAGAAFSGQHLASYLLARTGGVSGAQAPNGPSVSTVHAAANVHTQGQP
jgi:L-lactate dehydrogenase complex protein LldE